METIGKVRRASRVGGKSIRSIARTMNMSRNTVRKVLRSEETEHRYRRGVRPKPKLGGYVAALEEMLEANEKKARKDRLTVKRIWFDLAGRGCGAGYNVVCRHAAQWRRGRGTGTGGAYVPLEFDPGEAYQFDWSQEHVVIAGATTKLKVAHLRLRHSRMSFVRAYPRETREMVFDAHDRAFESFGGSCRRGIYDNTGTAVDVISAGRERRFNRRFERMCSHHLVSPEACNPRSGWEKGQVERQVADIRGRLFAGCPRFESLECLNGWLSGRCAEHARTHPHPEIAGRTIRDVFEVDERPCLIPWAGRFDGFRPGTGRVSKTLLVSFDANRYSVEARAAGRTVDIEARADRVGFRLDGELVGDHGRGFGRGGTIYDPLHYLPVLERKPGALRNGAPFRNWKLPEPVEKVRARLAGFGDGGRQIVDILCAVRREGMEEVASACAEALASGAVSADVVPDILSRRRDPGPPPEIGTPEGLRLALEPEADCARYDLLLEAPDAAR